jgi:hypothetical protein
MKPTEIDPSTAPIPEFSELLRLTDPVLAESVDVLGMPQSVFGGFNARNLPRTKELAAFFGLTFAAVTAWSGGVAVADELCGPGWWHDGGYYDGQPICNPFPPPPATTTTTAAPRPTTTTTPRPTNPPSPGGGGSSSGGSGGGSTSGDSTATPRPAETTTTIDLDIDNDTFLRGTGFLPDIDDNSPGLGEQGAIEARTLGIDVDSGSEEANLNLQIAYTVNPNDWGRVVDNYAIYGINVLNTTTTSTTSTSTSTTTTTQVDIVADTSENEDSANSAAGVESTTEKRPTTVIAESDSGDGSGNNKLFTAGLAALAIAGLTGLTGLIARRRRNEDEPQISPQEFGESPAVGK